MGNYAGSGIVAVGTSKTALILGAASTVRPRLTGLSLSIGGGAPSGDTGCEVALRRATALGTSTSVTTNGNDPSSPAGLATLGQTATVEPTYSTGDAGIHRCFNPRATIQWAAYDPRSEIIAPATAANGLGIQMAAAGGATGNLFADMSWIE